LEHNHVTGTILFLLIVVGGLYALVKFINHIN
jgi:hypothetical protein